VKNDENKNIEDELNYFGKPKKISPAKKTRSGLAMFTAETGFNKIENDKREKERVQRETEEKHRRVTNFTASLGLD
jgi:hypothetical protein